MSGMAVFGTICMMVLHGIFRGYVMSVLWGWFVVPFFKLPSLSIPEALGLSTIVTMLTYQACAQEKNKEWYVSLLQGIFTSFFALGLGWVYRLFL